MSVTITRNTNAPAQFHAAVERVMTALVEETADGARANAPHVSGFLASTVVAVPPNHAGVAARTEQVGRTTKHAAAVPATDADTALVAVTALYAVSVELRHSFLLDAAFRASSRLAAIVQAHAL